MNSPIPDPKPDMTARRRYVVACLAGHGIGPEVTAAASRALARPGASTASRGVAPTLRRRGADPCGNLLPAATRHATVTADAVLASGDAAPSLEGVRAALDLRATVTRLPRRHRRSHGVCATRRRGGGLDPRTRLRDRQGSRGQARLRRPLERVNVRVDRHAECMRASTSSTSTLPEALGAGAGGGRSRGEPVLADTVRSPAARRSAALVA